MSTKKIANNVVRGTLVVLGAAASVTGLVGLYKINKKTDDVLKTVVTPEVATEVAEKVVEEVSK